MSSSRPIPERDSRCVPGGGSAGEQVKLGLSPAGRWSVAHHWLRGPPKRGGGGGVEPGLFSTWRAGVAREVLSLAGPEPAEPSDRRRSLLALWEAGSSGPRSRGRGVRLGPPSRPIARRLPSPTHEDSTARTRPPSPGPRDVAQPQSQEQGEARALRPRQPRFSPPLAKASPRLQGLVSSAHVGGSGPKAPAIPPPPPPRGPRTGKRAAPSVQSCCVENWTCGP